MPGHLSLVSYGQADLDIWMNPNSICLTWSSTSHNANHHQEGQDSGLCRYVIGHCQGRWGEIKLVLYYFILFFFFFSIFLCIFLVKRKMIFHILTKSFLFKRKIFWYPQAWRNNTPLIFMIDSTVNLISRLHNKCENNKYYSLYFDNT